MGRHWVRPNDNCEYHGKPTKRAECGRCNAAYMRAYLRRRRSESPAHAIWQRAHRRASKLGVVFSIDLQSIVVPDVCPVLGIPLVVGGQRSANSPSLDRIIPLKGYVPGNVRVISDKANRLKGDQSLQQLEGRAASSHGRHQGDYRRLAAYVRRELTVEVRCKLLDYGLSADRVQQITGLIASITGSDIMGDSSGDFSISSDEQLTLQGIEDEFGVHRRRVLLLRRRASFPSPTRHGTTFLFKRSEVEDWFANLSSTSTAQKLLRSKNAA